MTIPAPACGQADEYAFSDEEFENIRRILLAKRRFDAGIYKDRYMRRRITIRIRATESRSARHYRELLDSCEDEVDRLLRVLTVHVSEFFRNRSTFDRLRDTFLPSFLSRCGGNPDAGPSIWSAGCAGGEEPYSLAIILREWFPDRAAQGQVSVLATDIDREILDKAREGYFGEERLQEVPPELIRRYFVREGRRFLISPEIRCMVEFRHGDLLDVATYPRCDIILCRNVLIYFERKQQERILEGFAASLSDQGVLVLGRSESLVGEMRKRFECVSPVERIYLKTA